MTHSISGLARLTGVTVKTIRFYSDRGLLPETARTPAGYRRYDDSAVARLELIRALRELGFDLATIRTIADRHHDLAALAGAHLHALDAQIRRLTLRRAVLAAIVRTSSDPMEIHRMTAFANASADEARRIVEEFLDTIFDGHADNAVATRMRAALPELPSEPSAEQIDAWVELATLVHDDAFRARVREMVVAGDAERRVRNLIATDEATQAAGALVLEKAGAATQAGIGPDTPQARDVLDSIVPAFADAAGADDTPAYRAALLAQMERFTDRRVDRYWRLIGVINGWPERPDMFGPYAWFIDALRAAG